MSERESDADRYERGWKRLAALDREIGPSIVANLADVAPDLARYAVEFCFGDIYSRAGLSPAEREIVSISALVASGNAPAQLKVHVAGALRAGLTQDQVAEIIIQMAVYSGFPAAINAMAVAKEVFQSAGGSAQAD